MTRRAAEWLVAYLVPDAEAREAILGDLTEEWHALATVHGPATATRWVWWQVAASAPHFLAADARRGGPALAWAVLRATLLSYAALVVLVLLSNALIGALLAPGAPAEGGSGPGTAALLAFLAGDVLCALAAGWLAGGIGRRAPRATALALGVTCALFGLVLALGSSGAPPRWYQFALALVVLPVVVCGERLHARRRRLGGRSRPRPPSPRSLP
jgi:MFS family permease